MRSGILKTHSNFFIAILHLLDPCAVIICSILFYYQKWFLPLSFIKILSILSILLIIMIFPFFGLYRSWRGETLRKEAKTVFFAWMLVQLISIALIFILAGDEQIKSLLPYEKFQTQSFLLWILAIYLSIILMRLGGRVILRYFRKRGWNQRSAVIIGAGQVGLDLAQYLNKTSTIGVKIVGFFDDKSGDNVEIKVESNYKLPILGLISDSIPYVLEHKLDMVIIALPMSAEKKINKIVWGLGLQGVNVLIAPDLFAFGLQKARLIQWGNIHVMAFNLFPQWKRIFDIIFSSIILLILFLPMLFIGWLVKREDKGPVFYRHKRIGECGIAFYCLKFRTMEVDADKHLQDLLESDPVLKKEWEQNYKLKNDPRITKIGKFLRKTSLDELPQFINVLKGEMSVVGARPVVLDELTRYYNHSALTYCSMKPGVTGPWQVGKRNDIGDYEQRVQQDRFYVLNTSLWLDIKLIFKTILKMFWSNGAY